MSEGTLSAVIASNSDTVQAKPPKCNICDGPSALLSRATVLGRHEVSYFRCTNCGFTYPEAPYWLEEAYQRPILDIDIGPVNRCFQTSEMTWALLLTLFSSWGRYVDYGGGHGMFVRRMRDLGFDFRYYDRYPSNMFARGFEAIDRSGYELLTAFEVFEHLVDPMEGIREMLQFSPSIFFSTMLLPDSLPKPGEWWYYLLDHGQHVSLYTRRSLAVVAERCHCNLVTDGVLFHLLTPKRIKPAVFRAVIHPRTRLLIGELGSWLKGIRSRLPDDFAQSAGFRFD